jgi:hypothetical protein
MKGFANSIKYKIIKKTDYKLIILIFTLFIINTNLFTQNGGNWTWIHGEHNDSMWSYGIKGVPSPNNMPPSRANTGGSWIDKEGNFWMFSGKIGNIHSLNDGATDLWKYDPKTNIWTWISGDTSSRYLNGLYSQHGVYGTKGVPSVNNYPISRSNSMCWTDTAGNLWLFGGEMASGCSNVFWCWTLNIKTLNDLWKYNVKNNEWTWVSGDNPYANVFTPMNRGIKGIEDTNNFPGVRSFTNCSWVEGDKLYFYGGVGQFDFCSDVWYYSISKNLWVWESGLDIFRDTGHYGSYRIPNPTTRPNARKTELSCKYKNAIYIYSGESFGGVGVNNDLWKYDLNTHLWSWVDGKKTTKPYILDTGIPPSKNCDSSFQYPDTRDFHSTIAANNLELKNFIMFGGRIAYSSDYHNDLWAYNLDSLKWKRISGNTNSLNKIGNWGLKNVTNSINEIYGVASAATWIDKNSNLYFFSGLGKQGCTNSLWKFEPDPKCIQFNNDTKLIKSVNDTSFCYMLVRNLTTVNDKI